MHTCVQCSSLIRVRHTTWHTRGEPINEAAGLRAYYKSEILAIKHIRKPLFLRKAYTYLFSCPDWGTNKSIAMRIHRRGGATLGSSPPSRHPLPLHAHTHTNPAAAGQAMAMEDGKLPRPWKREDRPFLSKSAVGPQVHKAQLVAKRYIHPNPPDPINPERRGIDRGWDWECNWGVGLWERLRLRRETLAAAGGRTGKPRRQCKEERPGFRVGARSSRSSPGAAGGGARSQGGQGLEGEETEDSRRSGQRSQGGQGVVLCGQHR